MKLGISSDAAPAASLGELLGACARRGLTALELSLGTAAVDTGADMPDDAAARIVGLLGVAAGAYAHQLSALSRVVRAPVIVGGSGDIRSRTIFTRSILEHGGLARVLVHGPADMWLPAILDAGVPFAWQIDDTCVDPARDAEHILLRGSRIDYVRLVGGGPETTLQEGRGIGPLMRRLTLAGYDGPIILAPSSPRFHVAWDTWLGRRGGWGCGSSHLRAPLPIQLNGKVS